MASSESRRHDLYTVLSALLGADNADTLMDYLPTEPGHRLVTTGDLDLLEVRLGARLEGLESQMDRFETRMDRFEGRMERFEERMDRLFLALFAGMVAVVATLITALLAV